MRGEREREKERERESRDRKEKKMLYNTAQVDCLKTIKLSHTLKWTGMAPWYSGWVQYGQK